jgi:hypothetical protein
MAGGTRLAVLDGTVVEMTGTRFVVPWPFLVVDGPPSGEAITTALSEVVRQCFEEARGELVPFMDLMRPFDRWESDASPPGRHV